MVQTPVAFRPDRHIPRSAKVEYRKLREGVEYAIFHLPWTKTTATEGGDVILTAVEGFLDPVTALRHHLRINRAVPGSAPFFAFADGAEGGWKPMTRTWFLARCNAVWSEAGLKNLTGHCFRIGGATELLLRGTHPDVVATLGGWKSRAFLDYWRQIESIIPLFVSKASDASRVLSMRASMEDFRRRHGS